MDFKLKLPSTSILKKHYESNGGLWLRNVCPKSNVNHVMWLIVFRVNNLGGIEFLYQEDGTGSWNILSGSFWHESSYVPLSMEYEILDWAQL